MVFLISISDSATKADEECTLNKQQLIYTKFYRRVVNK